MPIDDVVVSAEHCLKRSLEPIEKLILQASWQGQPYNVIAENSGYANVYVREVGARLWQALSEALGTKVTKKTLSLVMEATSQSPPNQLDYPSGPLSSDSPLYIERTELSQQALVALARPGCLIRIQSPRCMGKTSFLFRLLEWAKEQNYRIASLSLRQIEPAITQTFDAFAKWLLVVVASQLNLPQEKLSQEARAIGGRLHLSMALKQLLEQAEHPVVLALRDIDTLSERPELITTFCSLLAGWHEEARRDRTWSKLRLIVSYTQDVELPGDSGLRWGLELRLRPLNFEQAIQLAQSYGWITGSKEGIGESAEAKLRQLMDWVGGHPYLLAIAFYHLSNRSGLQDITANATGSDNVFSSYLRSYLVWLQEQPEYAVALRTVVSARGPVSLPSTQGRALEAAGLVSLQNIQAKPGCELYRQYFAHHLRSISTLPIPTLEVSDLQRLEARIESLTRQVASLTKASYFDRLSQFTNRDFFEQRVKQACDEANQNSTPLALLLCSFDHYDVYVKAYGYIQAENVLREIADCIRSCIEGPLENFSRYGSEQFIVLLSNYSLGRILAMGERLRERVEDLALPQSIGYMGWAQVVTVSIGVASKKAENKVAAAYLLSTAEKALSQAQRQGNNCIDVQDCKVESDKSDKSLKASPEN